MTVENLIKQLEKMNPKAEVRINNIRGSIALWASTNKESDTVWIEGKDDINVGDELRSMFNYAKETGIDETAVYTELLEMGFTLDDIQKNCSDKYEPMKAFIEQHDMM